MLALRRRRLPCHREGVQPDLPRAGDDYRQPHPPDVNQSHRRVSSPYTVATSGATDYVSISLYTSYGNDFTRTFTAPTAVALTEPSQIYSGNVYTPVIVFDGSDSAVPENDSIVSWSWTISAGGSSCLQLSGEKVLIPQSEFPSGSYSVLLTVTDSGGLAGTATIPFVSTVTSPAVLACPSQGQSGTPVTLTGTGFTGMTAITNTISGGAAVTPCGATTSSAGSFTCSVTITGPASGNPYTVTATGADGPPDQATASYTILPPTVTLTPAQGPTGEQVTASGSGFAAIMSTVTFTISAGGSIGGEADA